MMPFRGFIGDADTLFSAKKYVFGDFAVSEVR